MEYIDSIGESDLSFVICGYNTELIYHEYNDKKDSLDAGEPLSIETAKIIFNHINEVVDSEEYGFKGMIPKNVLSYKTKEKFVIWETKEMIKHILYKKGLPIKTGDYYVPRLVWKLENKKLSVWAVKKTVTSETEKLYNAPFFNIYNDGSICMGNSKFTEQSYDYSKIIAKAEAGFWNSIFTHTICNNLLKMNFADWCNDESLNKKKCNDLLFYSGRTIKNIL